MAMLGGTHLLYRTVQLELTSHPLLQLDELTDITKLIPRNIFCYEAWLKEAVTRLLSYIVIFRGSL